MNLNDTNSLVSLQTLLECIYPESIGVIEVWVGFHKLIQWAKCNKWCLDEFSEAMHLDRSLTDWDMAERASIKEHENVFFKKPCKVCSGVGRGSQIFGNVMIGHLLREALLEPPSETRITEGMSTLPNTMHNSIQHQVNLRNSTYKNRQLVGVWHIAQVMAALRMVQNWRCSVGNQCSMWIRWMALPVQPLPEAFLCR